MPRDFYGPLKMQEERRRGQQPDVYATTLYPKFEREHWPQVVYVKEIFDDLTSRFQIRRERAEWRVLSLSSRHRVALRFLRERTTYGPKAARVASRLIGVITAHIKTDTAVHRNWRKVKGGEAKSNAGLSAVPFDGTVPPPGVPSEFDGLSIEAQLVGETLVSHDPYEINPGEMDDNGLTITTPGGLTFTTRRRNAAELLRRLAAAGLSLDDL
jgi:hypothetical protein